MLLIALAAAAPHPQVQLAWRGADHTLLVVPPEGHEVAPDAPSTLRLGWGTGELAFDGIDLTSVATPDLRAQAVSGSLSVTLCAKADGTCTPTTWEVSGNGGSGKKGQVSLLVTTPAPQVAHAPFNQPADATIEEAFAQAKREGKPLLLDFSAVWCPPCNLLSAEVLHAESPPDVLGDYVVALVDVDHPSSFALKSRYAVGGYPTVVVTDPDGNERSRTVGYPGKHAFEQWLRSAATSTDALDLAAGASTVAPERALELAWLLLQDRRSDDAAPFVARGANVDNALARRVRTMVEPTEVDVNWLLANDLDAIGEWFGVALDLKESNPLLAKSVVRQAIRRLDGPALADAFYVQGEITGEVADYEAAASALRTAMTGNPEADKGHITWLAQLTSHTDVDEAIAILDDARARWPNEPTWDLSAASIYGSHDRHADALEAALRAQSSSWGDNGLRASLAAATALVALKRTDEATAVIDKALSTEAPASDVSVRTHRYRTQLEELRP